jgi:hypothetical protein
MDRAQIERAIASGQGWSTHGKDVAKNIWSDSYNGRCRHSSTLSLCFPSTLSEKECAHLDFNECIFLSAHDREHQTAQ